jgi:predicted nucleic acid-binding protein
MSEAEFVDTNVLVYAHDRDAGEKRVHFSDALLVVSAQRAGAIRLWSEDLQSGARFGEVEIRNPFTHPLAVDEH